MFRYCLADIAKGLFNGMIGNFLIYFFQPTNASGLPNLLPQNKLFGFITVMALLTGIGKIIDAVTDPIVASLSDRCTHPDGRRLPFLRYAAVPYALSVLLIFYAPFREGSTANAVWVGFFLFAYYTAYTFFFIPRNALVPEIIPDAKARVGYYGISTAFFMGSSSFMYAATLFVNLLKQGGLSPLWAWRTVFTVFALIGVTCLLISATAFREKDYVRGSTRPKESLFKSLTLVFRNRNFVIFGLGDLFSGVSMAFFQTAMLYYITVLLHVPESQSFLVMLSAIAVALCLFPLIVKLSRAYNKKIPLVAASVVFTIVFGFIYFGDAIAALAPGRELLVGLGMGITVAFPFAAINILPQSVLSDIIQLDSLENGINREESFPTLTAKAERMQFGSGCFIYRICGNNPQKTVMLMSHHDVVDGGEGWNSNPFCATIQDDTLYGRGTIDTKTPLFAQLQACEELLREGYGFEGLNLYIGSSNNEEVGGDGMVLAANHFREQGIRFDIILDEGGAITTGMIPGVTVKSAVVVVHEKGRHLFRCTATLKANGHGGLIPTEDSTITRLSAFIQEIQKANIYKGSFAPEVRATFETHAPYMTFPLNVLFGHFRLFAPLIRKIMLGIPQAKAMLYTSIAFTTFSAGSKEELQIRPKEAEVTMLLRCVREDDLYKGLEKIKKIAEKHGVQIEELERDYCRPTDFTAQPYQLVEQVLKENFPDVIVAPFLLTAGTDARHFSDVADSILRFAPIDLDKAQFASIHGANEHIKIQNIGQGVLFYKNFIQRVEES